MAEILCIESSSKNCSVAWSSGGEITSVEERATDHYSHAEDLHLFINHIVKKAGRFPDAVAVSKGPGSYTGLRIGISAAKGLCFSWNVPLIAIGTLDILAHYGAKHYPHNDLIIPMIDARRMEVYCAHFDGAGKAMSEVKAIVLDAPYFESFSEQNVLVLGDGAAKIGAFIGEKKIISDVVLPSATMLAELVEEKYSAGEFENLAYFEPYYLKEFLPGISKKDLLKKE